MPHVPIIFKGEGKTIELTVTDANDVVIDLDTANEIIVRLLDENRNTIEKYNKGGTGGFMALDIPVPADGIMSLFLNADQADVAARGFMAAEVKMQFPDPNFDGGVIETVTLVESLARIKDSETQNDL